MLGTIILVVAFIGVLIFAGWLVKTALREDELMREALEQDRAFDESIRIHPLDETQLIRLAHLVEEVGILRLPNAEKQRGRHKVVADRYHVFLIDSLGAIHDVIKTFQRQEAADLAVALARRLDVKLVDRERIVG